MKALEFFSGIGGLRYALLKASPSATILAAFDINDIANDVYEHNFGHRPLAVDVSNLTVKQLDAWGADIWLMSPPCQPYTRRGLQKQSADARSAGFLCLIDKLQEMKYPPRYLLLENVVGFEASDTAAMLRAELTAQDYHYQEFIVSPDQLGIPYSRPRYFGLARRGQPLPLTSRHDEAPFQGPPLLLQTAQGTLLSSTPTPLGPFLASNKSIPMLHFCALEDIYLSDDILRKHGWCLDMVGPESTRVNCITKAYSHFLKGSGSVLATDQSHLIPTILARFPAGEKPKESGNEEELLEFLGQLKLRFLSPGEVATLHSFPISQSLFSFPETVSLRQRYQLLGNSLSVAVVADLLSYLLHDDQPIK